MSVASSTDPTSVSGLPRVVYEINTESDRLEPRLRLLVSAAGVGGGNDRSSLLSLPILETLERYGGESPTPPTPPEDDELEGGGKDEDSVDHEAEKERAGSPESVIELSYVSVHHPYFHPPHHCLA